jgi:hypothetical protein
MFMFFLFSMFMFVNFSIHCLLFFSLVDDVVEPDGLWRTFAT